MSHPDDIRTRAHRLLSEHGANGAECNSHAIVLQGVCDTIVELLTKLDKAEAWGDKMGRERDDRRFDVNLPLRKKATAWDAFVRLWSEFSDEGAEQAVGIIGEFVGEWEHWLGRQEGNDGNDDFDKGGMR